MPSFVLHIPSWEGGHPGRHAGWKPALLEPHPFEDPRNNMYHPSREGSFFYPLLGGVPRERRGGFLVSMIVQ